MDLSKWIAFAENRVCYVLDAHRPVHLANLHSGPVRVLADQQLDKQDIPSDGSDLSGEEEEEEEETEEEDSGEEAMDSEDEGPKEVSPSASRKRPRRRQPRSARKCVPPRIAPRRRCA